MEMARDDILHVLDALQEGMNTLREEKHLDAKQAGYIHGYEDALKNMRFIVSTIWTPERECE